MKKYEEYKETVYDWLGQVPSHWSLIKNKHLFSEREEKSAHGDEELLSVSQYTGITKKKDSTNNQGMFSAESLVGYKLVYKDDFVMNIMLAWNGSYGISKYGGVVSPAYCVFKLKKKNNPWYFDYLLRTSMYSGAFKTLSRGIIDSRLRLYPDKFYTFFSIYPPLREQDQIVKYLDWKVAKINKYIKAKKRQIELLKELKQAEINRAVTKGLDPTVPMKDSGVDWIGEIPEHWKFDTLKRYIKSSKSGAWGEEPKNNDNDTNCIRIADFDYDRLTIKEGIDYTVRNYKEDTIKSLVLNKGDILIEKSGGGDKTPAGRTVLFNLDIKALYANFIEKISVREYIVPEYLVYFLSKVYSFGIVWKYIKQTTGLQNLDLKNFISTEKVHVPYINEQLVIVEYLRDVGHKIDRLIEKIRLQIIESEEYKRSLISDVVTGKVDVRDIIVPDNYESESVAEDIIEDNDDLETIN